MFLANAASLGLRGMCRQNEAQAHPVEQAPQLLTAHALCFEPRQCAAQRSPLRRVIGRGFVLPPSPDAVVALGDVYQLEVHRERPHDPPELPCAHSLYARLEPLVEFGVVVEAEPLTEQPDLLLCPEQSFALLL